MKITALISLIKSLSKGEKRNFKILANKSGKKDKLYVLLFDWLEAQNSLDVSRLLKKHPQIKASQIPNLKNILYKSILRSLREINKDYYKEIHAREQFDFAKILYSKGAYPESIKYLQKAKSLALELHNSSLKYLALDFEKQIESQHITGSMSIRAQELVMESRQLMSTIETTDKLSNLSLLLYGRYLKKGFVRNMYDGEKLKKFFQENCPPFEERALDFRQRLYLYQSYSWYYYMFQDYVNNFRYALKWVNLFERNLEMVEVDTSLYLKGLHNVLSSLFIANKTDKFLEYLSKLDSLESNKKIHWNFNERSLLNLFQQLHKINAVFLTANYEQADEIVEPIILELENETSGYDQSRLLVFYYKIACVYFGRKEYDQVIYWLNKIINGSFGDLKQDVQSFARILSLITHYELGNSILVDNQIITVFRSLLRMKELGEVQRAILQFLRRTSKISRKSLSPEFVLLRNQLTEISEDIYERRAFLFLDLIAWLDSKIYGISMVEAIKRNRGLI